MELTQTDFSYLLDLAGIEFPADEVRAVDRRRVLDELGLSWLCPELVATEPAREHVRQWIATQGRHASDDRATRERYAERVVIAGEPGLVDAAHRHLARVVPVPLLDHLAGLRVLGVIGRRASGYTEMLPDLAGPRALLLCCWTGADRDFEVVVVHEACHAWFMRVPTVRRSADELRDLRRRELRAATDWGLLDQLAAEVAKAERNCVRLLHALGYADEDLDRAVQNARRDLYEQAQLEAARRRDEADDLEAAVADVPDDPDEAGA